MAMKSSTGKLFMLLSSMGEDDDFVNKTILIEEIMNMPEYREIQLITGFEDTFNNYYSYKKLNDNDIEKLEEIKECISFSEKVITKLKTAIFYGNGYILDEKDIPDFHSLISLKDLYNKLDTDNLKFNKTNINETNFMAIFLESTIKDDILNIKEGCFYCINGDL